MSWPSGRSYITVAVAQCCLASSNWVVSYATSFRLDHSDLETGKETESVWFLLYQLLGSTVAFLFPSHPTPSHLIPPHPIPSSSNLLSLFLLSSLCGEGAGVHMSVHMQKSEDNF